MDALRAHPVIAAVMLVCTIAGVVLGVTLLPEEWWLLRRVAAGAVAGAGSGLLITAPKMLE